MTFQGKLQAACEQNRTLLCIGLDPDPALMATLDIKEFNRSIVDATHDLVCAYKPNLAFYESAGLAGIDALADTVSYIHDTAPGVIVLADAKRGDIGSTNVHYARALFETWGFDATTVIGYTGGEALKPFLDYSDKGVFVLCRSSNPGAGEIQDLEVAQAREATVVYQAGEGTALYQWLATQTKAWSGDGNIGLVVGATYPKELAEVRKLCPGLPILAPAVGAQAGDLEASVKAGVDSDGRNLIVSSSRSVTYASRDKKDYASAARTAAERLRDDINRVLRENGTPW